MVASLNSLAMVEAMVEPESNRFLGKACELPMMKVTAMVSPSARPRPSMIAPTALRLIEGSDTFMISLFSGVPVLNAVFAGPPSYLSLFNASLILAIMVLPFITAISVDVFKTVPPVLKEAAYGVGCTTWEVVNSVVIPYTRVGIIGGVMLALGRALGETMAVTFIIGNSFRISSSIFGPGTTISAAIASEFAESDGLHQSGLILLGLLLFVLTFFVLAAARLMLLRLEKKAGN